jgi:serine/threonine protein phosphatase PrpC
VVVASDGLWDYVNAKSMQKLLKEGEEPDVIARNLIKMALAQGSVDNISVIVVRL